MSPQSGTSSPGISKQLMGRSGGSLPRGWQELGELPWFCGGTGGKWGSDGFQPSENEEMSWELSGSAREEESVEEDSELP